MRGALLLLALACALPASVARAADKKTAAAAPEVLRCDDGRAPVLTGHPFRPYACPPGGKEAPRGDVAVSTANAPLGAKGGDLGELDGTWRGLCYFAGERYECELTVSDGGKRASWLAMDYHTHLGETVEAVLTKPGWFSRGVPRVHLTMAHLPGVSLGGRVWLARGVAACKFDGRPEVHRVEYQVEGDRLSAKYTDFDPRGTAAVSFTLDRVRP